MTDSDRRLVAMAQLAAKVKDELPYQIELYEMTAKLTRAKFDALVRAGFNDAQALELSKTI